jgi:hypothetical protein
VNVVADLRIRRVTLRAASNADEHLLTERLVGRQRAAEVWSARHHSNERLIELRLIRLDRAHELRECGSNAIARDLRCSERSLEQRWVILGRADFGDEVRQRHSHFRRVLNGHQHLSLEGGCALVPKEPAALIEASIREAHRVSPRKTSLETSTEPSGVAERERLLVA